MSNIYHRYLNLPLEYPKPTQYFVKPNGYNYNNFFKLENVEPAFVDWIASHNCKLSNVIEMFYTSAAGGKIPIHNDTGIMPGTADIVKINFTWGSNNSYLQWWRAINQSKIVRHFHDLDSDTNQGFGLNNVTPDIECQWACTVDQSDAVLVHQAVINQPSLINAGQLHSTWNPDHSQDRWTLSFVPLKLNGDMILFDEALSIFKDCIVEL
jgi:hypothetical protein